MRFTRPILLAVVVVLLPLATASGALALVVTVATGIWSIPSLRWADNVIGVADASFLTPQPALAGSDIRQQPVPMWRPL